MRVLGIDPGLSRCGVGVVDGPASRPRAVRAGVVRTPADQPIAQRLLHLHDTLASLIEAVSPDAVAVERVFVNLNVRTAVGVGQAAGVALLCASKAGVPVTEYTPTQVKARVTGSGDADKGQVGYMVAVQLGLEVAPKPADAADALALALCHLHAGGPRSGAQGIPPRLARAVAGAGPGAQVVQRGGRQ